MKKFVIEDAFWNLFPSAKIGVVICNDIDNSIKDEDYKKIILKGEEEALKYLEDSEFSNNQVIKVWREAFKNLKRKRSKVFY